MHPLDRLKSLYRDMFYRGQEEVAREQEAKDYVEGQAVMREAADAAAKTIDLANELDKDNDPHKKQLAALIKEYAVGGLGQVASGRLPAEEGRAVESRPFSRDSSSSRASLPDSTKPLPLEPPPQQPLPPPAKRGRGRPRKHPPPQA